MADELMRTQTGALVAALTQQGLEGVLKPLLREIALVDTWAAGTTRLDDPSVPESLRPGDRLQLTRESSRFDENAIRLTTEDGRKLGYVPEKDEPILARLMDAGKLLGARVTSVEKKGGFTQVGLSIHMVDV